MKPLVLAIDQGTTNTKAALVNAAGKIIARGIAPVPIYHPRPGWVEQNPEEIWQSALAAVSACIKGRESAVVAVGISNQRESVLAWDASSGQAAGPCVTWQCRRAADICARLEKAGGAKQVRAKTGLPLDPLFSAGKARWLARQAKCSARKLRIGTVDSWLLWKLTGGKIHACDESNASRTLLFNINTGKWDSELCEMFGVARGCLPEVLPSDGNFGLVSGLPFIPDGVPVMSAIGDSHAALFGHGIIVPGKVKATYGTGSSLMTILAQSNGGGELGVAKTIAWNVGGKRVLALEGNILVSASALPKAAEWLGLKGSVAKLASLAKTAENTEGVHFVPALVGLGAPHWNAGARGLFSGLTFNSNAKHLARAAMESIAWQVCDVFEAMAECSAMPLKLLYADGGPSGNDWLMQMQADFLGAPVMQCRAPDVSALGAAGIAGIAAGIWRDSSEFANLPRARHIIEPSMPPKQRRLLRNEWRNAVARALEAAPPATAANRKRKNR